MRDGVRERELKRYDMKLTKIAGTNIMGATFNVNLGALNIIFGENLSGKTRIRRAIELALLGFVPGLDKKPREIFRLNSGHGKMEVEAAFDSGAAIHRSFVLVGESVK